MAKKQQKHKKISNRTKVGFVITGILSILVVHQYALAVIDGLGYHSQSEFRKIAPNFVAPAPKAVQVPDFTLKDRWGNELQLSQFKDLDLLVVNIWSSGCPVCREEVPALTKLDQSLSSIGKAALITIAIEEKWTDVSNYFPEGTDLRVLFDPEDRVGKGIFGTEKYPETFVLDRNLRIRARFDGAREWHSDAMLKYLASFI